MAFPNIFGANGHGKDQHEFEEGDDDYDQTVFVISTVEEGVNSGKNTILRAATLEESDEWVATIEQVPTRGSSVIPNPEPRTPNPEP
jgi:hypothetical protein